MISSRTDTGFSGYNKKVWAVAFIVAVLAVLVYLPALKNEFVNWDDDLYVYETPHIKYIDFEFFKWMFTTVHATNYWHPLTWLSHAIDYAIWGLNPLGHHLTSILFHGLNTFLVVILIMRLINYAQYKALSPTLPDGRQAGPSIEGGELHTPSSPLERGLSPIIAGAVTGLLFGLHPLHVESVAWISERKDVLYAFFFLLSILSYLRYASSLQKQELSGHPSPVTRHWWYSLCLLFFILSLMSKPMAVTLPVVLLILDIYPLERFNFRSAFTSHRKVLIEKIPFMVLSITSSVIIVMTHQETITASEVYPLSERCLVGARALCFYLIKMLWPAHLAPLYPYPSRISFFLSEYLGASMLVLSITAFCIYSWRKQKIWSVLWAYYLVTLLPVLGIIQPGDQAAADRYTYLPSLGPFVLISLAATFIRGRVYGKQNISKFIKLSLVVSFLMILSFLSLTTLKQITIWKNSLILWNTELKMFSDFYRAYNNRGDAYSRSGNYLQAIFDYDKAIELNPLYIRAYINRGAAYEALGNHMQALEDLNRAIELNKIDPVTYNNRGNIYVNLKKYHQAIVDYNKAIDIDPIYTLAYYNRAIAYEKINDFVHAVKDYDKAIELNPRFAYAYSNRGSVYEYSGYYQKALEDYTMAIKLTPPNYLPYHNRGMLYKKIGNYKEANNDFKIAARLGDKKARDYLKSKGIGW